MNTFSKFASGLLIGGVLSGCNPQEKTFDLATHPIAIQVTLTNANKSVVAVLCRNSDGNITRIDGFEKFKTTTQGKLPSRGHYIRPLSGMNYDKNIGGSKLGIGTKAMIFDGNRMIYDSTMFHNNPEYQYLEIATTDGVVFRYLSPKENSRISVITENKRDKMGTLLSQCSQVPTDKEKPEVFEITTK